MNSTELQTSIERLASEDGMIIQQARKSLVEAKNHEVTHALIAELVDPRKRVRWEAAKALAEIGEPVAALPLVHSMDDDESDVAWVAAEGVAAMGQPGLLAVLSGLTRTSRSGSFYKAAHHSLQEFRKHGTEVPTLEPVIEALEGIGPSLSASVAAYQALQKLRTSSVSS
jgi:HEAT repeat protein